MSLQKIAGSNDSYLTKCAGIAGLFADGAITGDEADIAATEMGLSPLDVRSVYDINHTQNLEKEAGEDIEETQLEKMAMIADAYASDEIDDEALAKIAEVEGLDIADIQDVYSLAYGESAEEYYDENLDKTASYDDLSDVLNAEETSHLEKTAAIAHAFQNGVITEEAAKETAYNFNIAERDLVTIANA